MIVLTTVEDRLAFEIGCQVLARHRLEVQADALRARIAELEAAQAAPASKKED